MSVCAGGCGVELAPNRGPGPPRKWCSEACRKRTLYGTSCVDCGKQTSWPTGGYPDGHLRCMDCMGVKIHAERHWTPEQVVRTLQAWASELGRPPTAREALQAGSPMPCKVVQREFGSWNAGILAAGFTPRGVGKRGPNRIKRKAAA